MTAQAHKLLWSPAPVNHTGRMIRERISIRATPHELWLALADPIHLASWFVERAGGEAVTGGTLLWHFDKLGFTAPMQVVHAAAGERLVLLPPDFGPSPQPQDFRIYPAGAETIVELIHSGFPEAGERDDEFEGVRSDWYVALRILKHYAENYFGLAKRSLLVIRRTNASYAAIAERFRCAEGLRSWLTVSGAIGGEGDHVELILGDGGSITGRVLAATPRDVAIAWQEINGMISLKAFTFPTLGRMIAISVHGWHMSEAVAIETETALHGYIDRLHAELGG